MPSCGQGLDIPRLTAALSQGTAYALVVYEEDDIPARHVCSERIQDSGRRQTFQGDYLC